MNKNTSMTVGTLLALIDWASYAKDQVLKNDRAEGVKRDERIWVWAKEAASVLEDYPGDVDQEAVAAMIYNMILAWDGGVEADRAIKLN